jgi:hypothetical protein
VLEFFEEKAFFRALTSLEKDSGQRLRQYGKEIDFFYDLVNDGLLDKAC